ncbi:ABC transporter family substrate-binding protein [Naasia aerilata]|uniref:Peptide ABC transporter substrate-binding protein n=1 Tax=Naasia aerilata TaxID=1162966 RepID=A0ABN6XMD8_9MICO|nr:ABC transporter family substrate-binding protein [Naasia aerilata]BDZ46162.1 peptide ABC transporter substrate-binding protein [Naasia aerilata]
MIRKSTALAGIAVFGVGVALLAGCSTPTPSKSSAPAAELPLVGYKDVAYDDVTQGGTLNIAAAYGPNDVGNWNTAQANTADVVVLDFLAPTLGSPAIADAKGNWKPDPNFATSIELTSEDPQVVNVKLNPDAKFEGGQPITAADYQALFAAFSGKDEAYEIASSAGYDDVASFDVVSDTEFNVTFDTPYADWPNLFLANPIPASIASDPTVFNTGYVDKPVPSIGPYKFDTLDADAGVYTFVPNPDWWGPKPKLDKITMTVIEDQTAQANAFADDTLDAVEIVTPDQLSIASAKKGATIQTSGGLTYAQVTLNATAEPLDDLDVRKAVAKSIDREAIAAVMYAGMDAEPTTDGNYIFMPGQTGYEDVVGKDLAYDLKGAAQLLEKAGWKHDESAKKWTKDGKDLTLSVTVPDGTPSNSARAEQVQSSLAKNDIKVTIDTVPSGDYFTDISSGKFQMVSFGWQGTLFPISTAESLFYPAGDPAKPDEGQNYSFTTDESLGDLWDKANSELDPDKRLEIAKKINHVIAGFVPMVPIAPYVEKYATDGDLANFGTATFQSSDWTKVGFTK